MLSLSKLTSSMYFRTELYVEVDHCLDENLSAIIPRHPESERRLVAAGDKGVYARVSEA